MASKGIKKYSPSKRQFFKRNYVDAIELITPDLYIQDDISASGYETKVVNEVLNFHLKTIQAMTTTGSGLDLSAVPNYSVLSALNTVNGLSQFSIPQNNLTNITPQGFERDILLPLEKI